jgi:hypothetical protein
VKPENATPQCANPNIKYYGGPVMSNVQVVLVYWNSNVNATAQAELPAFYQGITNSAYYDSLSEYSTNVASVTQFGTNYGETNQSIGRGSFVGAYTIVPSVCPASVTDSCALFDTDLQLELQTQIANNVLPAAVYDSNGNPNTLYAIYFPPNIDLDDNTDGGICNYFCAYHSTSTLSEPLIYSAIPDMFNWACAADCSLSPDWPNGIDAYAFETMTYTSAHELAESVSDAAIGLDFGPLFYGYPGAWGTNQNSCVYGPGGEIADVCDDNIGATVPTPTGSYLINELWSNQLNECVSAGSHPIYALSTSSTPQAGTPFSFTLTAQNPSGGLGTDIAYIGKAHFTSSDPHATLPADYTFTSADRGAANFNATLTAAVGATQTITATDT